MKGKHRKPWGPWNRQNEKAVEAWAGDAPVELRNTDPLIVAHPGEVVSRNDGDVHRISFVQLCQLYGVDPRTTLNSAHPAHASLARYRRDLGYDVIDLFPREDGGYDGAALVLGLTR